MSDPIDDGGSAFPKIHTELAEQYGQFYGRVYSHGGMSLRDYFAAKAMAAVIVRNEDAFMNPSMAAEWAFQCADAMIKELARR